MRVCPECGTQYEDHVPTCIADGAVLTLPAPALAEVATALTPVASRHGAGSPPASAGPSPSTNAPPSPTPTPAAARTQRTPGVSSGGPTPAPARRTPTPAPTAPPPQPQPSGPRTGLFVALSGLLLLGFAGVGLVVVLAVVTTGMGSRQETAVAPAPPPKPAPVVVHPEPEPEPEEQPPIVVPLLSQPPGASVFENDQLVCVTPCSVAHPPHAPLPRTFVFRLDGFRDHPYEMSAAEGPIAVALVRLRSSPASQPTSATPRPSIGRDR